MAKKKTGSVPPKLTEAEQDLVWHMEHGYQLETDSLGGDPVLRFGLLRLMTGVPPGFGVSPLEPKNAEAITRRMANRPEVMAMTAEQSCAATDNGRDVPDGGTGDPEVDNAARRAGALGDRPLIVLTAGRSFEPADPRGKQEAAEFHQIWVHQLQPQLAGLSTRGRQLIVPNSAHAINFDAPDQVINAVYDVVKLVQATRMAPKP